MFHDDSTSDKSSTDDELSDETRESGIRSFINEIPEQNKTKKDSYFSIPQPSLPSLNSSTGLMNSLVLILAFSSITWVPAMVIGGKNKLKTKKNNKRI
jgi:hypothetical protein